MSILESFFYSSVTPDNKKQRGFLWLIFFLWLSIVIYEKANHAIFRDETRAFSLATGAKNLSDLLKSLHNEGHPTLWYLLIDATHAIIPTPMALQVLSLTIAALAALAALLFLFYSPFSITIKTMIISSQFFLFEYSVMSRNYGISMLLIFLFASLYEKCKEKGITLGLLLFLLANTNIPSVIPTCSALLFWSFDLQRTINSKYLSSITRNFSLNALIACAGIFFAILTVYPTTNVMAPSENYHANIMKIILASITQAGESLFLLVGNNDQSKTGTILGSLLIFASTLGLYSNKGLFISSLLSAFLFSMFFLVIYPGDMRHQDIWLTYLIASYWILFNKRKYQYAHSSFIQHIGSAAFLILLSLSIINSIRYSAMAYTNIPYSASQDLARLVSSNQSLQNAIITSDRDYLLDALPYYLTNPLYFPRERKFGKYFVTTKPNPHDHISLQSILDEASILHRTYGRNIVILLGNHIDGKTPARILFEGPYRTGDWTLAITPTQIQTFLRATKQIASFRRAITNEAYDVYLFPRDATEQQSH